MPLVFSRCARDRCRLELVGRQESWLRYRVFGVAGPGGTPRGFVAARDLGARLVLFLRGSFADHEVLTAKSALPGGHAHLGRRWPPRSRRPRGTAPWLNRSADWAKHRSQSRMSEGCDAQGGACSVW